MNKKYSHPLIWIWQGMMNRCHNVNDKRYKWYGAKGVTVDKRWHVFWNFVEDVDQNLLNGHLLYQKKYQLDKDINGGKTYSLENCVVVSIKENLEEKLKKQRKKVLATNGVNDLIFDSISQAANSLQIPRQTLYHYLKNGMKHQSGYVFQHI